jgi:hypothetical protein
MPSRYPAFGLSKCDSIGRDIGVPFAMGSEVKTRSRLKSAAAGSGKKTDSRMVQTRKAMVAPILSTDGNNCLL